MILTTLASDRFTISLDRPAQGKGTVADVLELCGSNGAKAPHLRDCVPQLAVFPWRDSARNS